MSERKKYYEKLAKITALFLAMIVLLSSCAVFGGLGADSTNVIILGEPGVKNSDEKVNPLDTTSPFETIADGTTNSGIDNTSKVLTIPDNVIVDPITGEHAKADRLRIVINQPYINEEFEIYTAERFAYVGCIEVDYRRPFAPAEGNNIKILYDIIFEKQTAESMLKKKD